MRGPATNQPLQALERIADAGLDVVAIGQQVLVAAAAADGPTVVRGAAELRVKESDRLATMSAGLRQLGIRVDETPDGADIHPGAFRPAADGSTRASRPSGCGSRVWVSMPASA